MAQPFTFEEAQAPQAFSFEEAQAPAVPTKSFSFEEAQSPEPFTFEQVAKDPATNPGVPSIKLSPLEKAKMNYSGPAIGPYGPEHPEEVLALPDILKIPAAVVEKTGMMQAASDLASDWLNRTGIDPSATPGRPMWDTGPLPITNIPGTGFSPLRWMAPDIASGVEDAAGKIASGFTEPGQALLLPFSGLKPVQAAFGAGMVGQVPDDVRRLMEAQSLKEGSEAATAATVNALMGVGIAKHLGGDRGASAPGEIVESKPAPKVFSEFGGEAELPERTVPEQPETIAAQLEWVRQGKRSAVLVTPGAEKPPTPEGMAEHSTAAGVFIFDPTKVSAAALDEAVKSGRVGDVLGYGISTKPDQAVGVVTVRGADGTEKQAVATDQANAPGVVAAAQAVAGPGDKVALESADQVIAGRTEPQQAKGPVSVILRGAVRDMLEARDPMPVRLVDEFNRQADVPLAMPEGYRLEGDKYVYHEPATAETSAQRMAREQLEAMEALRQAKATEPAEPAAEPTPSSSSPRLAPVEEGLPGMEMGAAPDILDWIGEAYPRGVRLLSKADYGEYVKQARGRAKELLSLTKGEAADRVINAMHLDGLWPRIDTPDDLADAMLRAGEARIAARRKPKATVDDPWQATIDKLNGLKMDTNGQLHAFGLVPEAWNTLIDLVKLGVRGGKAIADAVDWALTRFKELHPTATFDEGAARAHLVSNLGARATAEKIAGSDAISEATKDSVNEYLYQRRTNATDDELAAGILTQFGVDGAEKILRDPTANVHGATWSRLLGQVTRTLAEQEREARSGQNLDQAQQLAERQAALWDALLPRITEQAQGLQALNDMVAMSPDAQVARLKRRLDQAADEAVHRRAPETAQMQDALEQGRQDGLEAVRQDPAVNGAARAAVDEAVANHDEVKNAVVMELAQPWASSSVVLQAAREQVRAKANELLNRQPQPRGLTATQHLRAVLDDLAGRAASIFAAHIQGADPGLDIVDKYVQRLGLTREKAQSLATAMSKEWDRQLKEAQAKLPKRIAAQRVARERAAAGALGVGAPDGAVEAAIRKHLKDLNLKLGDVLRQEAERQQRTGAHVAERVVQASGLSGEAADTLRTTLQQRWDALVTQAQTARLEALQRQSGVSLTRPMKSVFQKLVELDRLGALSHADFFDLVKRQLKLKQLTAGDAAELRRLAQHAQRQPEGSFLRQQAQADVLKLTERLSGNASLKDLPLAIFYANILSGLTTPAKIVFENTNLLAGHTIAALLSRPGELRHPVQFARALGAAYGRGLVKGGLQAAGTLRSGVVSGLWPEARTPTILEMKPFGAKGEALNIWKWFGRVISTSHELTFKPAWELKQTLLARDVARREGLAGEPLQRRVADLMANTREHVTAARAQALQDLQASGTRWNRLDLARRTRELLEGQREQNMPGVTETARDYALRTAYLNEPYGFLGVLTKGIRSTLEQGRKEYPVLGTGVKTQVPFTTVVANILNEKLNWSPVGLVRAAISHKTGELYGRPMMDPRERAELYTKAILGTVALGVMGELFGDHLHGNGPGDPRKRRQLEATGWIPHSIEWNGRYYSYMNTPAGLGLALVGNVLDWHRYGKGDQADGVGRLAFATKATLNAIVSQGMLDSVKRVFESLGSESTTEGADKLQKLAARTASSFVVPNLVQQVDRMFDPTVYDKNQMDGLVKSQIPFVRRDNRPVLNVLGEPLQASPFKFWESAAVADPVWSTLAAKQAWIPEPGKNQFIGDKQRGPDYYRAMTPDEYYDWIATTGPEIRQRLMERLDQVVTGTPAEAQALVRKIANDEHAKGKLKYR